MASPHFGMGPVASLLVQRIGIGFLLILAISALLFIGVEMLPGESDLAVAAPEWWKGRHTGLKIR